jgi:hypothetical protein
MDSDFAKCAIDLLREGFQGVHLKSNLRNQLLLSQAVLKSITG